MRLACIYAVLDHSRVVLPAHLKAGLAVWEYAEGSARLIFREKTGNPLEDTIIAKMRERGPLTNTEIHNAMSRNHPAKDVNRALEDLHAQGLVDDHKEPTKGRTRTVWSPRA